MRGVPKPLTLRCSVNSREPQCIVPSIPSPRSSGWELPVPISCGALSLAFASQLGALQERGQERAFQGAREGKGDVCRSSRCARRSPHRCAGWQPSRVTGVLRGSPAQR